MNTPSEEEIHASVDGHCLRSPLAIAAMLVLGVGGWQVRAKREYIVGPSMGDVLQACRLFASAQPASFGILGGPSDHLQARLDTGSAWRAPRCRSISDAHNAERICMR